MSRRIASLVGGLAIPKQQRLLGQHPEVIVGTPGRWVWGGVMSHSIWYFMEEHAIPLDAFNALRFVVADEADKLVAL